MAAARQHGGGVVLADALITRGAATAILGDAAGIGLLREGIALARAAEDGAVLCRGYANLIVALEFTGRPAEACRRRAGGAGAPAGVRPRAGRRRRAGVQRGQHAPPPRCTTSDARRCSPISSTGGSCRGRACTCTSSGPSCSCAMGDVAGARASLTAAAPLQDVDEPAVVAAIATATAELLAQEGDRDGCFRTVDEALRRLAGTQDTIFRTELLLIGLRNEADRAGPVPARARAPTPRPGSTGSPPSWTGLAARSRRRRRANGRTTGRRRNELARAPRDRDRRRLGRGRAPLGRGRTAPRGGVLPAAAGRVPRRRPPARQGRSCGGRRREPWPRGSARPRSSPTVDALLARSRLSAAPAPRSPVEDRPYGLTERELRGPRRSWAPERPTGRSPGSCSSASARWGSTCPVSCISSRSPTGRRPRPSRSKVAR